MALTVYQLCSRALLKIGANTISSFDEGTAEAEIAGNLYGSARDALLSAHPWSFATGQITPPKLAASPLADFQCAYQLPNDFLRVLSLGETDMKTGRGVLYRIHERRIHTNTDGVMLTYIFRPDESIFPAFFDAALIARLSAEFSMPLTENTARTEALFKQAEMEFRQAKLIDSQQQAPVVFEDFSLIRARGAS